MDGSAIETPRRRLIKVSRFVTHLLNKAILVSTMMEEGEPRKVLIQAAEEWVADCIFIGANGHRFIRRFLLGNTLWAVAAQSALLGRSYPRSGAAKRV